MAFFHPYPVDTHTSGGGSATPASTTTQAPTTTTTTQAPTPAPGTGTNGGASAFKKPHSYRAYGGSGAKCTYGDIRAIHGTTAQFEVCHDSRWTVINCPPKTMFHSELNICVHNLTVKTTTTVAP